MIELASHGNRLKSLQSFVRQLLLVEVDSLWPLDSWDTSRLWMYLKLQRRLCHLSSNLSWVGSSVQRKLETSLSPVWLYRQPLTCTCKSREQCYPSLQNSTTRSIWEMWPKFSKAFSCVSHSKSLRMTSMQNFGYMSALASSQTVFAPKKISKSTSRLQAIFWQSNSRWSIRNLKKYSL